MEHSGADLVKLELMNVYCFNLRICFPISFFLIPCSIRLLPFKTTKDILVPRHCTHSEWESPSIGAIYEEQL